MRLCERQQQLTIGRKMSQKIRCIAEDDIFPKQDSGSCYSWHVLNKETGSVGKRKGLMKCYTVEPLN